MHAKSNNQIDWTLVMRIGVFMVGEKYSILGPLERGQYNILFSAAQFGHFLLVLQVQKKNRKKSKMVSL